jgi:hypothetical protein
MEGGFHVLNSCAPSAHFVNPVKHLLVEGFAIQSSVSKWPCRHRYWPGTTRPNFQCLGNARSDSHLGKFRDHRLSACLQTGSRTCYVDRSLGKCKKQVQRVCWRCGRPDSPASNRNVTQCDRASAQRGSVRVCLRWEKGCSHCSLLLRSTMVVQQELIGEPGFCTHRHAQSASEHETGPPNLLPRQHSHRPSRFWGLGALPCTAQRCSATSSGEISLFSGVRSVTAIDQKSSATPRTARALLSFGQFKLPRIKKLKGEKLK